MQHTTKLALLSPCLWVCSCTDEPLPSATTATSPDTPTPTSFDREPTTDDASGTGPTTSDGAATSGSEATTIDDGRTTAQDTYCGDGVVDADEECDDGPLNSDDAYCTSKCRLAYCGDGLLFAGQELCDDGAANSDEYGSVCDPLCAPGSRCGDHIVQPEHETCDLGPDNGGPNGDAQGIPCSATCRLQARRGFVSSATVTGDLGGVFVADALCKQLATAAGDPQADAYHAFLSTSEQSVAERFAPLLGDPMPYVTPTGKKFTDSFVQLLELGPSGPGISVTETGETLLDVYVLTNTAPDGATSDPELDCDGWTNPDGQLAARVGITFFSDPAFAQAWSEGSWWTDFKTWPCDYAAYHLYCLEL